jgi:hypothetical protein
MLQADLLLLLFLSSSLSSFPYFSKIKSRVAYIDFPVQKFQNSSFHLLLSFSAIIFLWEYTQKLFYVSYPHQPETQQQQHTYAVGFRSSGCSLRMVGEKPKHVRAYDVFI